MMRMPIKRDGTMPSFSDCFRSSFAWTPELLVPYFSHCIDPVRAARQKLSRLERFGELASTTLTAIKPPTHAALLHVCTPEDAGTLPSGRLAWSSEKYFKQPARPIRIWWPTKRLAKRYHFSCGKNQLSAKNEAAISHELLVTATWNALFRRNPAEALAQWQSEKQVESQASKNRRSGTLPDGVLLRTDPVAVEVLDATPSRSLRRRQRDYLNALAGLNSGEQSCE